MSTEGPEDAFIGIFFSFFFRGRRKFRICCYVFGGLCDSVFLFLVWASFQMSHTLWTIMGGLEGETLKKGDTSTLLLITETLKLWTQSWNSPLHFGITTLTDSDSSLADSPTCMLCVCISHSRKTIRRKDIAIAEPLVTFNVIETCFFAIVVLRNQCMPFFFFLTESAR